MLKEINIGGRIIVYNLIYKKVKNINLRINSKGEISVSARKSINEKFIEDFLILKRDFIFNALDKVSNAPALTKYFEVEDLKSFIKIVCRNIYPYYEKRGIEYPEIKFRKMISQWGNCRPKQNVLTFSTNLIYAPKECVEYVVYHEFTHFLEANHSKVFYDELFNVCPDWKKLRDKLKEIYIKR